MLQSRPGWVETDSKTGVHWHVRTPTGTMNGVNSNAEGATSKSMSSPKDELLHRLAELCGISTEYTGQNGSRVEVSAETVVFALQEFGLNVPDQPSEADLSTAEAELRKERRSRLVEPTVTALADTATHFPINHAENENVRAWVELEEGGDAVHLEIESRTSTGGNCSLPPLPAGWHTLHVEAQSSTHQRAIEATLLVSPEKLSSAQKFVDAPATGVMAQIYSLRDRESWGIGDYRTLRELGDALHRLGGADFILVNPMHAAEAAPPVEDSPYLPTTRRFTNPIYIRVEDTPEYQLHPELRETIAGMKESLSQSNGSAEKLERNPVVASKMRALYELWTAGIGEEREAELRTYREKEGAGLEEFADWCSENARDYGAEHGMELSADYYAWVQMLCQEQESAAQDALREHMRIGLMADLAVGVHPGGADAHILADALAPGASVGAPPDGYNQLGQDWSQPPWHPRKLAEQGYKPWRDMLRTILRSAGGIRVDHVLGLFRLWWIPRGASPTEGTYVKYDHEALIGTLVLEAERAGAVVIGEDLGTFEPWVQEYLASRGVMGTSVAWFEGDDDGAKSPDKYRQLALTSVTTHDLPPTASYLRGGHIDLRDKLGVLTQDPEDEFADDARWQQEVLSTMGEAGAFAGYPCESYFQADGQVTQESEQPRNGRDNRPGGADGLAEFAEGRSSGILEGMHRFISLTPSALKCVALVDMVGDLRAQNQPGTTQDLYPNWCIPLCDHSGKALFVDDLLELPLARAVLSAARGDE